MAIISISDSQVNGADQILVADGSSKIPAKDGSQITILNATNVASGTIATARLDTGTTAGKLVVLDGSGNLPAVNGSLLTGIVSATISASDPTISTNPSGGVGTEWLNSTSGEMYICTDATAGENVWKNVGAGSDNVQPWYFGGTQYGYSYGGTSNSNINQWSLTSDGNATDVGDQSVERRNTGGASSATYGYNFGGWPSNVIDKFPFASGGTATDVGNLITTAGTQLRYMSSATTADYGWCAGGAGPDTDMIQRFAFASDGDASDWANLHTARSAGGTGMCSATHGYTSGSSENLTQIEKYPFASQSTSTDVGDMTVSTLSQIGMSSATNGYAAGGYATPSILRGIEKISFTTDGNSTDSGDITIDSGSGGTMAGRFLGTGVSSTTYGYTAGGGYPSPGLDGEASIIDKMSFSADGNSVDVGNLTQVDHYQGQGSQY